MRPNLYRCGPLASQLMNPCWTSFSRRRSLDLVNHEFFQRPLTADVTADLLLGGPTASGSGLWADRGFGHLREIVAHLETGSRKSALVGVLWLPSGTVRWPRRPNRLSTLQGDTRRFFFPEIGYRCATPGSAMSSRVTLSCSFGSVRAIRPTHGIVSLAL